MLSTSCNLQPHTGVLPAAKVLITLRSTTFVESKDSYGFTWDLTSFLTSINHFSCKSQWSKTSCVTPPSSTIWSSRTYHMILQHLSYDPPASTIWSSSIYHMIEKAELIFEWLALFVFPSWSFYSGDTQQQQCDFQVEKSYREVL